MHLLALVAVAVVALAAPACSGDDGGNAADGGSTSTTAGASGFAGYTRSPAPDVSQVTLPAADGSGDVAMPAAPGGYRIMYFGYTSCPDVCPTTMSDLKRALAALPAEDRARIQVDMVTIDPGRDTGEKLTDYVRTFIPEASGLRTEDDTVLRAAADAFGADYSVTPAADGGEPEVSHTAELYAVDDAGRVVIAWPFGISSEDLADDLTRLLAGEQPESQG